MKRGAITKSSSRLINLWIPEVMVPVIDMAVVDSDTDRAKFIRSAIREKLQRDHPQLVPKKAA